MSQISGTIAVIMYVFPQFFLKLVAQGFSKYPRKSLS